jgi:hypothetical protein
MYNSAKSASKKSLKLSNQTLPKSSVSSLTPYNFYTVLTNLFHENYVLREKHSKNKVTMYENAKFLLST